MTTLTADDGTVVRDLNGNGLIDPYEDPRLPTERRVADLLRQMTIEEKVGQMFQTMVMVGPGDALDDGSPGAVTEMVAEQAMTHFNVLFINDVVEAAAWHNRVQELAAGSRLGIPVTLSTDPRHGGIDNAAATFSSGAMSRWPEANGFGAIGDVDVVRGFADIARQEYCAIGLRAALHPQIDLASDPRWGRQNATFGTDAELSGAFARAYLEGFQQARLGKSSVACMTKHFPGGGPQLDGEDPHFAYGREQVYPGNRFDLHLLPFRAAIDAGTSAIMPYYGMPVGLEYGGRPVEQVGFAFSRQIMTDLLRDELGFDGVICTDWGLITEKQVFGEVMPARAWGVEHLSEAARLKKLIDAGCDQLGGESCTRLLLDLVESGEVSETRIDESVTRLLAVKFDLGLFDDPFVDLSAIASIVGRDEFVAAGYAAQQRSVTVLANDDTLPLTPGSRVHAVGFDPGGVEGIEFVDTPAEADVAVVRIACPHEPRSDSFLESFFKAGDLEVDVDTVAMLAELASEVRVVLDVHLERAAVLTPVMPHVGALVGTFGSSAPALFDVLRGDVQPGGRLPMELPGSMTAVEASRPDVPNDTEEPLFAVGHGLSFER
jgi:beta-glucosidase